MPWVGSLFRRVEDTYNEVELIILVTPRFISEVDPAKVPAGPGTQTVLPCDKDFFWRGYQEVPRTGSSYELGIEESVLTPNPVETGSALGAGQPGGRNDQNVQDQEVPRVHPETSAGLNLSRGNKHAAMSFRPLPTNGSTFDQYTHNQTKTRSTRATHEEPISRFHLSDER